MLHRMAFCLSGEPVALHLVRVLLRLIFVMKLVQCLFSVQTSLLHTESG